MYTTFGQPLTGCMRLICFPYAGAGAGAYRRWLGRFPGLDLAVARLPGRDNLFGQPAITGFAPLVQYLLDDIGTYTDLPFVLFGHSMGGLLAYEVARRLQDGGRPPALLVVSGAESPQDVGTRPRRESLDDASVLEVMRRNGGTPKEALADSELMRLMIPVLRADLKVLDSYRYRHRRSSLRVPTRFYFGADDEPDPELPRKEWEEAVGAPVTAHEFPGDHFFLHSAHDAVTRTLAGHIDMAVRLRDDG